MLLPAGQDGLALARHDELDLKLRQAASRIADSFLGFCDLATVAIAEKIYERFGYLDERPYFEERVGVSYRNLRRWLSVAEGLRRLPEVEQSDARAAIAELGSHKAAVLAPLLGEQPWQPWVDKARAMTEGALQEAVSAARGVPLRTLAARSTDRFLHMVLRSIPEDTRDEVEAVFRALMRVAETQDSVVAFLVAVRLAARDLQDQGISVAGEIHESA